MRSPVTRHRLWQIVVDALLIAAAWILSWYVRFDGDTGPVYYERYLEWDVIVLVVGVTLPVFVAFGFYNRWWRYVSTSDMWSAVRGVFVAVVATFLVFTLLDFHPASVPRGIWVVDALLLLAFVTGSRFLAARTLIERPSAGRDRRARQGGRDRRGRRRGAADPARDAQEPGARLHAHRARRRRSPEEEPPPARRSACSGRRESSGTSCATGAPTSC